MNEYIYTYMKVNHHDTCKKINYKGGGEGGWLKIMFTNFAKEGRKGGDQ